MSEGDRDPEILAQVSLALFDGLPRRSVLAAVGPMRRAIPGPIARHLVRIYTRLEGGIGRSRSFRGALLERDGVVCGAWSQGPGIGLGALPPNTVIGRYCSIGPGFHLANENHPMDRFSTSGWFYDPICGLVEARRLPHRPMIAVGHDVWIGANVCVLPRVRSIGHGAVIGAGSVVTRDVPAFAIVAGNPARVIRHRLEGEATRRWLDSRWWRLAPAQALAACEAGVTHAGAEIWSDRLDASDRAFEALLAPKSP